MLKTKSKLRLMIERIIKEESYLDRTSKDSADINDRLKKFIKEKDPERTFIEYREMFNDEADPYNMKTPSKRFELYYNIVDKFLKEQGY